MRKTLEAQRRVEGAQGPETEEALSEVGGGEGKDEARCCGGLGGDQEGGFCSGWNSTEEAKSSASPACKEPSP